MPELKYS